MSNRVAIVNFRMNERGGDSTGSSYRSIALIDVHVRDHACHENMI